MGQNDPISSMNATSSNTATSSHEEETLSSSQVENTVTTPAMDLEAMIQAAVRMVLSKSSAVNTALPSETREPIRVVAEPDTNANIRNITENTPTASMSAISVRIVPLQSQDPRLWFHMVEAQFALSRITSECTKYHHLLCALNDKVSNEVGDIISGPISDTPYSDLKKAILSRLGESRQTQIHRLLRGIELGDMKPSQLLRQLKASGGSAVDEEIVKQIWMKRLPLRAQEILATSAEALPAGQLAELADRILETRSQATISAISTPAANSTEHDMMSRIDAIIKRLDEREARQNWHSNQSRHSRSQSTRRGAPRSQSSEQSSHGRQTRSPTPGNKNENGDDAPRKCFYHYRFKEAARNCRPHCPEWESFKQKN